MMSEKINLLIIDDDPAECETLADSIHHRTGGKYKIDTATSVLEALTKFKENKFHVALVDIRMPEKKETSEKDGIGLLKTFKNFDPHIEVIMMTAYASVESAVTSLNLGAFSYLTKPLNIDEVIVKLEKASQKQQTSVALDEKIMELEEANRKVIEREERMLALEKEIENLKNKLK